MTAERWSVVVPFKGGNAAKSRLTQGERAALSDEARADLAVAFLLDTVAALAASGRVGSIVVVTGPDGRRRLGPGLVDVAAAAAPASAASSSADDGEVSVTVVDDPGAGLNAAVLAGLAHLSERDPRAAVLGDLPVLLPADAAEGFDAARGFTRAFVADHVGTGTTAVFAAPGIRLTPSFGPDSAAAHLRAGLTALDLRDDSTLRRDIDTIDDLDDASERGLGARTALVRRTMVRASAAPTPH